MKDLVCDLCGHAGEIFQYHVDSCELVCGTCLHIEQQYGDHVPPIVLRALGILYWAKSWNSVRVQARALISHDRVLRGEP